MPIKKIAFFIFIIFSLLVINGLLNSIFDLSQKHDLLDKAKRVLIVEKKKNMELKNQLKTVNQSQFVEQEARNKLFLVKPGEGIMVIESKEYLKSSPSIALKPIDQRLNWQKWLDLFFGQ